MTAIARTHRTVTLSEIPFAITGVLVRNARREAKRQRSWFKRVAKRVHSARIGRETIESNLPVTQASSPEPSRGRPARSL